MLLGKRPRPQVMKKTSSLTEFSIGAGVLETLLPSDQTAVDHKTDFTTINQRRHAAPLFGPVDGGMSGYLSSTVSPRNWRRNSADFAAETASFLKACGLCKRRLAPGKDIYMYRGEFAFCSSECRQQQMTMDERKEKCSLTSRIIVDHPQPSKATASALPESSGNGGVAEETVAAA